MTTALPPRPDLAQLKRLAKELLRAHQLGDDTVCPSLRTLLRFEMATDAEILAADIKLHDVQFALARGYGFSSWDALKHHIERITMTALVEGKTKVVRSGPSDDTVYLETKDCLTGGDAARREVILNIGLDKTIQTANVFTLLRKHGLPVSFIEQTSPRELLCHRCDMLPLELVVRRFAWGSFLLRHPEYRTTDNTPLRFGEPYCEFFHKHAVVSTPISDTPYQMIEDDARQQFLHDGVWAKGVYTDPFLQVVDEQWIIYPAKESLAEAQPLMRIEPLCSQEEYQQIIDSLLIPAFLVLEEAWKEIETAHGPVALVDMKLEVGRRQSDNRIVIADVIDNDSWRIWPGGNPHQQLDKQCFRDGDSLVNVAEKYSVVTQLTNQFLR